MTILNEIIANKRVELALRKKEVTLEALKKGELFDHRVCSVTQRLRSKEATGIIAEFKTQSPSKGIINPSAVVEEVTKGYAKAGASAISVLTDEQYFGGSLNNLLRAKKANPDMPVLRKDFIIDEYQLYEAKAFGADFILLIAAALPGDELRFLAQKAKALGLEVLTEIHEAEEIEKLNDYIDLVGVNNRNLKTFRVDVGTSVSLVDKIPDRFLKISESGLRDTNTIHQLRQVGFSGFLMGESFMEKADPAMACKNFITEMKR